MDGNIQEHIMYTINNKAEIINNTRDTKNKKSVTVITPVYNAESTVERCIKSIIRQSISFDEIEYILVDDFSTDNSKDILLKYAAEYPDNITVVLLKENTGTAAMPRNIGIELTTTDKVMFLDADDWLDVKGVEHLTKLMDETGNDFVVGKTIKVNEKSESIHAEFMSYKETRHTNPFDLPYIFYHMGPPSKMIKTSIIKENNIRFPELKFGEDKYFFFRVLLASSMVSVVNEKIYYVNRFISNNSSLTSVTDTLDKRYVDLEILKYVLSLDLPEEKEKVLVKRLVEYDLIRTCNSMVFLKSDKKETYIELIRTALSMLKDRSYNIMDTFDSPLYRMAGELINQKQDNEVIKLFTWYKRDKNKRIVIENSIAHYEVPFLPDNHEFKNLPIPLYARFLDVYVKDNHIVHEIEIYGEKINEIEHALVRDRVRLDNEVQVPIQINNNKGVFKLALEEMDKLINGLFTTFIRYEGHKLINIKRTSQKNVVYNDREFTTYISKADNVSFSIKNK